MTQWKTAADQAQAAGQPTPPPPEPSRRRPPSPTAPDGGTNPPGNLFNAMVSPLIPYGIKGVIWYQGESNADDLNQAELYATLFPTMIQDWRTRWGEGDFPFLYVQLAGFKSGGATCVWPWLRESQQDTLSLPATGMATAVDIGNPTDIHPKDKLDVGLRLALVARRVAYGENVVASGPARTLSAVLGNKIRIQFDQQVMLGQPPWTPPGVTPPSTAAPTDFLIAGADEKFLPAQAKLDHDSVTVWNDTISQPVAVRYDWSNSPDGNLYDTHGLPALPFRTDHWEPGPIENLAVIPQPQSGAGWVQKFRENVARVKGARVDLIFDGDSITDWFQTTGKPVWQQFYAGRHATDFAIAGDRTDHLLWRLDHGQVDGLDPKLVVLLIGTNNTIRDSSGQIATGVQACVNEYLKRCPHARILLLALFPRRTPADLLRLKVDAVNAKLAATHFDDRVTYLDIGKIFLKGQEKINLSLVPGRLHPNLAGYQAWAEAMEPAISRLLPADAAH
jgi:lysophospholipase L1-like esterase